MSLTRNNNIRGHNPAYYLIWAAVTLVVGCQDPYTPRTSTTDLNYLVVEGSFNTGGELTTIELKRTNAITEDNNFAHEAGASVQIEGDDGGQYALNETSEGVYSSLLTGLDLTRKYRLKIKTFNQKEYASEFVPVKQSPPIDTISYTVGEDVRISLSSHDPANNTHYYFWRFVETWKYSSQYPSEYSFDNGQVTVRHEKDTLYFCWTTKESEQILIGSSQKLAQDVISDYLLTAINIHSEKFVSRYSILVEQSALTQEAYAYWDQLKKNTESIGSIFDPQPSQSATNIHCVSDPTEPVVGYFSAGSVQRKRIFIDNYFDLPQVRRHSIYDDCKTTDVILLADLPNFDGNDLLITGYYPPRSAILIGYVKAPRICVDCRLNGGTNIKPDFWK